ncbi:N-6 DNA methylase [Saccharopolyspora cebuensis]|uniref:site-specific DNA-methyltransferase (adenine-specific) n=1 Tax=Saccharopolyspora cebuensis TaxID=418759 RepID=A0ABV4CG76_9PSEU
MSSRSPFPSLHTEGGLLPGGLFSRIVEDDSLPGRAPDTYDLAPHENVREAASRAFDYLGNAWNAFVRDRDKALDQGRPLGSVTRERWLLTLFRALDFGVLPTTPTGGIVVEDKTFPVSHHWGRVPIHLLGWGTDLDHRTKGLAGAASAAPQSMLQELLNRSEKHVWAIVSNGRKLRILRDSRALARSAYVEFDLELIFTDKLFSDFVLLFRLLHASRFAVADEEGPQQCWLEQWRSAGIDQGERARERLEKGVRKAIDALGTGFLQHPANQALRDQLAAKQLSREDYRRALLRLAYRLLFWFVTEDREVLLDPNAKLAATERYHRYFSARRLRERARRGGDRHSDLWEAVTLVFTALGEEKGREELALPGIGGLYARITRDENGNELNASRPDELDAPLEGQRLTNEALLTAIRALAVIDSDGQRRAVDFQHLDSEELGSVYERLLAFHPDLNPAERTFTLREAAGNDRKQTGSYYTPSSLTEALLDSTLDPLLDQAATFSTDPEQQIQALLEVTVCDPACGSGHFLVAAARRIAQRIAQIRSGEDQPSPTLVREAMREVVSRCIYGVDINEMAAELAKVSLWLESIEPGKPLAFLDANIRVGNALLGTTPALLADGIPKAAFKVIEGDDSEVAKELVKQNKREWDNPNQLGLFGMGEATQNNEKLGTDTRKLVTDLPTKLTDLYVQRTRLRALDRARLPLKREADAWCAAFVQEKTQEQREAAITNDVLTWIVDDDRDLLQNRIARRVDDLTRDYRFFHWHVEFPHIFRVADDMSGDETTGWNGGFTCVIGNPPWDHIELQDKEFFAVPREEIANTTTAAKRKKAIAALGESNDPADQALYAEYCTAARFIDTTVHLVTNSGRYPFTARGRIKTDPLFAETGRTLLAPRGRVGMVLPTGIATDSTTQHFFKDLVATQTLVSVFDFENEEKIFASVTNKFRFCIWTNAGHAAPQNEIKLAFRLRRPDQIGGRRYVLAPEDITLINPNTGTCPAFDYRRNAEITLDIYRSVPTVLRRDTPKENPWCIAFRQGLFNMATASAIFQEQKGLENAGWELDGNIFVRGEGAMLPLYEAKMLHHFDHRFSTYEGATKAQLNKGTLPRTSPEWKDVPALSALPRYWVPKDAVDDRLTDELQDHKSWDKGWLLGWRDITTSANERTLVASVLPRAAVGHTNPLMLSREGVPACLYANLTSFALDYVVRQKISGSHLTYGYVTQLPVLTPSDYECDCPWSSADQLSDWITTRVLELSYTSYDMAPFAEDHGDDGPPFRWDEERRFWLRAELDAAYFHLYGVKRDNVNYVMDSFRAFRNNDAKRFARTKQAILDLYDEIAKAITTGEPYRTVLDPPPGEGPRHPARTDAK